MLAYVFWHRPRDGVGAGEYVAALSAFHERIGVPSWFGALERPPWGEDAGWYEDWYLVEDWNGLGRLNEAAVSGPRKGPHDAAAAVAGEGTAGGYALRAGRPAGPDWAGWVGRGVFAARGRPPAGPEWGGGRAGPPELAYEAFVPALCAAAGPDASIWQRQMTLGPTPEFAVLAPTPVILPWPAVETGPG